MDYAAWIRVAVDIGGTFTDLEIDDPAAGCRHAHKTPTTPADPSIGLVRGLLEAADRFGFAPADVTTVVHGTTIATNAVLERKLAKAALVTTAGFEDVLEIGRHDRRDVYGTFARRPAPVIPRRLRFGLAERVGPDGAVRRPLEGAAVDALAERLRAAEVDAVAVCLLHAYANPAHERLVAERLRRHLPDVAISLSVDVSPEIREFERTATVAMNALLVPIVRAYLERLAARLAEAGLAPHVLLVQSNGGVCRPEKAAAEPARLLLSGPAGGAAALVRLAGELDRPDLVGVDMGGTSFDVTVVHDGAIATANEGTIDGHPVRLPMVEIHTIGAGGGSIAWIDASGRLRVGPESAGAEPGPAAYANGGTDATVTDAHVALGRLPPAAFLGGAMELDPDAALRVVRERVATPLGMTPQAAADGILEVTNSALATAIRLSLFKKGLDPSDFALVSFGGAGGLHACEVADAMGIGEVIFPAHAGTLSAYGILWSDIVHDLAAACFGRLDEAGARLAAGADALGREGEALLADDGVPPAARRFEWALDLRYRGQAFELTVPLAAAVFDDEGLARAATAFHERHRRRFAFDEPTTPVEVVNLRLRALGLAAEGGGASRPSHAERDTDAPVEDGVVEIVVQGGRRTVPVRSRGAITGATAGPLVVTEPFTTLFIPPGRRVEPTPGGHLRATREG